MPLVDINFNGSFFWENRVFLFFHYTFWPDISETMKSGCNLSPFQSVMVEASNDGKNIVYQFPNKISKNLLRIWLTRNLLVKPLTRVTIPSPDQPPWSFLDTSLLQYRKENLKVHAWINYNISICEKLGFGLHLILNTGYDLTTALGKCLMDPSIPLWHFSGLTSGKVKRFPHSCNTQLEKPLRYH